METEMFFNMRRYALRVTEAMGLNPRDPAAVELVSMIVQGAKEHRRTQRSVGKVLPDQSNVLMSVAMMTNNRSAYERLVDEGFDAITLLTDARAVGRAQALKLGETSLLEGVYDRLGDISHEYYMSRPTPQEALRQGIAELNR